MELADAFGKARWTRLQNVGRLDFEDPIVKHRLHAVPPRTVPDGGRSDLFPAPRRKDDLRIASSSLRGIHDPVARETRAGQLRKNRCAASHVDELLDPADS